MKKQQMTWREIHLEAERERDAQEYKDIIDKIYLTPTEIWTISERNFTLWRRKHEYPKLLQCFLEKLNGFDDWMKSSQISNEFLMSYGICNCINLHPGREKQKFLIEREWNGEKSRFISLQNLENRKSQMGPHPVNHKSLKHFVSYADWAKSKKISVYKNLRGYDLFRGGTGKSSPDTPNVQVTILDNFQLLKIGGCKIPTDQFGGVKSKYFELVNADNLILEGHLTTQSRTLGFESSSVDNLQCDNVDLSLVKISNCSVENTIIKNSNIQQWEFIESRVTGKLIDSDFALCTVLGGQFYLDFKGSTIQRSEARASRHENLSFEQTYRNFKQLYANQGDDSKAVEYFLLEKQIVRRKYKNEIKDARISFNYKVNTLVKIYYRTLHRIYFLLKLVASTLNHLFWGYGRQPLKIIPCSLAIILLCAGIIKYNEELILGIKSLDYIDSLYYSTVTFLTIGSSDFIPQGRLKILVIFEALLGVACVGFLIGGLSNSKY